ncbi:MAG: hypothetical protein IJH64_14900 [Oscillospiraceae bacterium]|nr:hypothetical protein [Oscillospiraceae bacterium]MBR0452153.1 hypothetical protein [Oscillospiraceae bacterium]
MVKESELIRRMRDLNERSERSASVTHSTFLTPAEQYEAEQWIKPQNINAVFIGGSSDSERKIAVFYPVYMDKADIQDSDFLSAVKITAGFGTPGHRDYLGSILGLGIKREWIGDIIIVDNIAYVICLPPSNLTILSDLTHVSRYGVRCESVSVQEVPMPKMNVKHISFTVQSRRLDAVIGCVFGISRSRAAKLISSGAVTLNYQECMKNDAYVDDGDVISARGFGKAILIGQTGQSRKGRIFLSADRYI